MQSTRKLSKFMAGHRIFIRSVYAETLLEDFFVAAVASVLAIRLYLYLTGYPSLTIGRLHIAHVLLGGVLMLFSLIILLAFLNYSTKELAAVIGGIGFGAFIDELGKFVTSDNDYFFEPTVALIYIVFVLIFFLIRVLSGQQAFSREECVANAFEIARQASITNLNSEEHELVVELLRQCKSEDTIVKNLEAILQEINPAHLTRPRLIARIKESLHRLYEYMAKTWWFTGAIIGFFTFVSITSLSTLVAVVQWSWALALWVSGGAVILGVLFWRRQTSFRYLNILVSVIIVVISILVTWAILASLKQKPFSFTDWAQFVFPSVSSVLIVVGLLQMPMSRLRAYRMFRLSILISIFFTQVLAFYQSQFFALIGLFGNIVVLLALRYLISHEQLKLEEKR